MADGYTKGNDDSVNNKNDDIARRIISKLARPAVTAKPKRTEGNKRKTIKQPVSSNNTNDKLALNKLVLQLIQRKQKSQQWPAVKVFPTMEVLVDGQKQQSLRMVPLEERIIFNDRSAVPGSLGEKKEMRDRLAAFDDFLFLIDD